MQATPMASDEEIDAFFRKYCGVSWRELEICIDYLASEAPSFQTALFFTFL